MRTGDELQHSRGCHSQDQTATFKQIRELYPDAWKTDRWYSHKLSLEDCDSIEFTSEEGFSGTPMIYAYLYRKVGKGRVYPFNTGRVIMSSLIQRLRDTEPKLLQRFLAAMRDECS